MNNHFKNPLLRTIVDIANQLPCSILFLNQDGRVIHQNPEFADQFGLDIESVPDSIFQLCPNLNFHGWRKCWESMKESGYFDLEENIESSGDTRIKIHIRGIRLSEEQNAICLTILTENKRGAGHQEKLNKFLSSGKGTGKPGMALLKHTINQVSDKVFWVNERGYIKYYNNAFARTTGYAKADFNTLRIDKFFIDYHFDDFLEEWQKSEAERKPSVERKLVCKGGKELWVDTRVNAIRIEETLYLGFILRNISEKKKREQRLEDQLKEIQELKDKLEKENIILKEDINVERSLNNIITQSPKYKRIMQLIGQVAETNATVLIQGETGTGKELIARAIYQLSERSGRQLIKVNCSVLPRHLIESELFGHEKGAFTGAHKRKIGRFELADEGTIFLDEVGEIPLELQPKLLRVLQEKEFRRLGGTEIIQVDVRVIAATNRHLEKMVEKGKFREDLYYRLNVFPIHNIPLRERKEDIPLLVSHFIEKFNSRIGKNVKEVPKYVMAKLTSYDYPGNVRELENIIERAVILSPGKTLSANINFRKSGRPLRHEIQSMEEMQKKHILTALRRTKGKITGKGGAAELLKMKDKTLYSRMRKLEIKRTDYLN